MRVFYTHSRNIFLITSTLEQRLALVPKTLSRFSLRKLLPKGKPAVSEPLDGFKFVDGEIQGLIPYYATLEGEIDVDAPLRIGQGASGETLPGAMADFRIYDAELNATQLTGLIQNTLADAPPVDPAATDHAVLSDWYAHRNGIISRGREQRVADTEVGRDYFVDNDVPSVMVLEELPEPRPAYRLIRGQYDTPDTSEVLQPHTPGFLHPFPADAPPNRLGLAKWLVDPANPLTARVTVNRVWQDFFGAGLVRTPDNFGMQGERPTHPELLDWLASEFVASGWDLKRCV